MGVWSGHEDWIRGLSDFLGCSLRLVDGSEIIREQSAFATLRGTLGPPPPRIALDLNVKLQVNRMDDGDIAVWALVFYFVDKRRVAAKGGCFLTLQLCGEKWERRGWEADVYGEWDELETLD